jgi:transposase
VVSNYSTVAWNGGWLSFYTLNETAKLNEVVLRAWLADVLARIADHPAHRIVDLLPWNWNAAPEQHRQTPAQAA